jgi:hypothetical protein
MSKKELKQCSHIDNNVQCERTTHVEFCRLHCKKYNKCKYLKRNNELCNKQCMNEYCVDHSENTRRIKKIYTKKRYHATKDVYKWVRMPIVNNMENTIQIN